ncbi:MAG: type II toxin-antitoxin system RelE/ParE family toxin [Isosphaeraceae bacterium]
MAFKIVWAEPAIADLEAIVGQLARSSPEAARTTGEAITSHVEVLRSFPRIGPCYPRDPKRLIRELVCGVYRIFYTVDEEQVRVQVLTIWHGSRQEPNLTRMTDQLD